MVKIPFRLSVDLGHKDIVYKLARRTPIYKLMLGTPIFLKLDLFTFYDYRFK